MDLLALLDMGRPSSPALGHLFLGLQTWAGPTHPSFLGSPACSLQIVGLLSPPLT